MAGFDYLSPDSFTDRAMETFYLPVDDPYFRDKDVDLIYETLKNQMRLVPFGDFLKRYIYRKAELDGDYRDIALSEYQAIIRDSFADRGTPASFTPTTARLSALAKNWLTQQTVKRSVVLLLGFGLGMSLEDVNEEFLTKALREQKLNPKDPMEAICEFCFRNHCGYPVFERLWKAFHALPEDGAPGDLLDEGTVSARSFTSGFRTEAQLMDYLRRLRRSDGGLRQSVTARETFDLLYARTRELAARLNDDANASDARVRALRMQERLSGSDRLFDYEKSRRMMRCKAERRPAIRPEDITPGDVERIICSAVPLGSHGNLMPAKASELCEQFSGKRFSRQHVSEVLAGKAGIDRFDLITLKFFTYAGDIEAHIHTRKRYSDFINSTNRMLERCGMGPLYIANPYECFILMCLLSEDPLGTYSDVLEVSYRSAAKD